MNQQLSEDPRQLYYQECKDMVETAKDILSKVTDQSLILEEYSVQLGCSTGFARACELMPDLVTKVVVDNCRLEPGSFTNLMKGFAFMKKIGSLQLKNIQIEDSAHLKTLLERVVPRNVDSLRIENCEIAPDCLSEVLASMLGSI